MGTVPGVPSFPLFARDIMARILLIDDDDAMRTALHLMLVHFGHIVIDARNGNEGLARYKDAYPDLLITDIVMPEKEGLEVLMELRKSSSPVKIIAISGGGRNNAMDYLYIAKRLGAAKVLEKPFSSEVLMAAVDEVLASDQKPAQAAGPQAKG